MKTCAEQIDNRRRRGSIYIMILGTVTILTVIGLAALATVRVETRAGGQANDWVEAQLLAFSAVEHALARIDATANWRTDLAGKTEEHSFGGGAFQWRLADELDGDLADDPADPFVIIATGKVHEAVYKLKHLCLIRGKPLETLGKSCLHAGGTVRIKRGWGVRHLLADGATVSTNGKLRIDKSCILYGRGEARSVDNRGEITEGYTESDDFSRAMPHERVWTMYSSMLRPVKIDNTASTVRNAVLNYTTNSLGQQTNADGAYFIDRGSGNLTLIHCNINGTLVVKCKKLVLRGLIRMQNYRSDFPALIVDGDVEMDFYTPGEIRGLVHVTGSLTLKNTARIRGAVICEGTVKCRGFNRITHLPELYTNPPLGYTTGDGQIHPETWTRISK